MNNNNRYLPLEVRSFIIGQAENEKPYREIVSNVEQKYGRIISKGTISKISAKFEETKTVDDL